MCIVVVSLYPTNHMSTPLQTLSTRMHRVLEKKLNKRVKRYILLTSLWSHLNSYKRDAINKETLKKLNMIMNLTDDADTLYIPALLGKVIWKDSLGNTTQIKDLEYSIESIEIRDPFFDRVLTCIPTWLKYDKNDVIEQDIKDLVKKHSVVSETE